MVFPPWHLDGLAWLALAPMLYVLRAETNAARGGLLGWVFGIAAAAVATGWLYGVLTHSYGLDRRIALAVMAGAIGFYTLFFGGFGVLTVWLERRWLPIPVAAAVAWCSAEAGRARVAEGLPWLQYGHSQASHLAVIQLADLGGVLGLSFLLVFVNACVVEIGLALRSRNLRRALRDSLAVLLLVAAVLLYGSWRLRGFAAPDPGAGTIRAGLVQVATPQSERWKPDFRERNLARQLALTREAVAAGAELVVWSETAIDFLSAEMPDLWERIAQALGNTPDRYLLVGLPHERREGAVRQFTNAAALVDGTGRVVATYDKIHLVPIAEREPFWIERYERVRRLLAPMLQGEPYQPGTSSAPLPGAGTEFGALICFEAIYPDLARASVEAGAEVLVNLSNDGFFVADAAVAQHFVMTVFRAVEERRPLLRVANRGVGAVVDPAGRVLGRIEPHERRALVAEIVPEQNQTLFYHFGYALPYAINGLAVLGFIPIKTRRAAKAE